MNVQIYTNSHKGQMFRRFLARNVNLQRVFLLLGDLIAIAAIVAAVTRVFLIESLDSSSSVEDSGVAAFFPRFSSSIS
jgi:hypothetical protein